VATAYFGVESLMSDLPPTPGRPDPDCIFCKIGAGQIPCYKIHEDSQVLVFLDIGPLSRGHCLVVPKAHYETLDQVPEDLIAACVALVPRLSRAVLAATGAKAWNLLQNNGSVAGQAVGHVHFHLIPRAPGDGLGYRWPAGKLDPALGASLAETISAGLRAG
jgi:histidine triad (HIT) family protein